LQKRLDVGLLSTKGMSNTAARKLLDELSQLVDHIFILHDFDISGFSICGTLRTNSRRYIFANDLTDKSVDIGLRLVDVEALDLESEPTAIPVNEWPARAHTLRRHSASREEIAFLQYRRVELNAMTSRQFVDFVEGKLLANGVQKVIPDDDVLEQQARRIFEARLTNREIAKLAERIAKEVKATPLPIELRSRIEKVFVEHPETSWDVAVALIISRGAP
jgi:hypothetical protein